MKISKKIFGSLLIALFFVCAVACAPAEEKEFFKVSLSYESAMGSVLLSQPENANGYAKDENVTVTVTPNAGYEVDVFSVNDEEKTLDLGTFSFHITSDTMIKVTFKETAPSVTEKFSVSLKYDSSEGNITLSPDAQDGKYEKDTEVTVTVKAGNGFTRKSVTVNGGEVSPDENGIFTFTVTQDTEITAVFEAVSSLPENAKFDEAFLGTWRSADGKRTLNITENSFELDGAQAVEIQRGSDAGGVYYSVKTAEGRYVLNWLEEQTGSVLNVWEAESDKEELYIKGTENLLGAQNAIDINVQGIWGYDADGDEEVDPESKLDLKINSTQVFMNEKTSDVVIYIEYVGNNSEKLYNYLFSIDGETHTFKWMPEDGGYYPVLDGERLARNRNVIYLNDIYQGTWNEIGGKSVMTVTENKITIDGEALKISGQYGAYDVTWKETLYEFRLDIGNEDLLFLSDVHYDENGLILSTTNIYFLREGVILPEVKLDAENCGTWTSAGQDDLVISENGVTWGNSRSVILRIEKSANSLLINAIMRGAYYEIRTRGDVLYLTAPGISHEFMREIEGRGEKGFLDLTIGVYTLGSDARLTVTRDSLTLVDDIKGVSVTLTMSDIHKTQEGYEFTWKGYGDGVQRDQPMIFTISEDKDGKKVITFHDTTTQPDEDGEYNYSVIYTFTLG